MHVTHGDMWNEIGVVDAVCITTNLYIKKDKTSVMGKGCARQARDRYPGIERLVGLANDNMVGFSGVARLQQDEGTWIVSFPVKPSIGFSDGTNVVSHQQFRFDSGSIVPGWAMKADLATIRRSAVQLAELADKQGWQNIVVPRPGCGAGELDWGIVCEVLDEHLDDRFTIITY
tara:strand:+ start:1648 stop:2169 length:522 start_codon:yes stop_codon:yes gene_type:complete